MSLAHHTPKDEIAACRGARSVAFDHRIPDGSATLRESRRVLRPGGRVPTVNRDFIRVSRSAVSST